MLYLRGVREQDFPVIDGIWRRHHSKDFGIPSSANAIDIKVLTSEDKVVGLGMVKLFAEGIIVLDKDMPKPTLAKAISVGIDHSLDVVKRAGLEQFHVFTDDPHYIEVLKKHWGFRIAPGTVLYREIDRG